MDLVKDLYENGKLYRLSMDPSGIDISGENQILRINSDKITGDLNIDGNIEINGNDNFVITNTGDVGIGTSIPLTVLNTNNLISLNDNDIREAGNTNPYPTESLWLGKTKNNSEQNYWGMSLGSTWIGHGYIQPLNTADTNTYYDLFLNPHGGNVGIGTTSGATAKLEVNGDITSSGNITSSGDIIASGEVKSNNNKILATQEYVTSQFATTNTNVTSQFATTNANVTTNTNDIASINSNILSKSGSNFYTHDRLGIGTSDPTCPLRITSTTDEDNYINAVYGYIYDTNESDGGIGNPIEPYSGVNIWYKGFVGDAYLDSFLNDGDLDTSIHTDGTIWTHRKLLTSSDERIKTDISNVDDDRALIQVNALESKEYHYIEPTRKRPIKTIGFIAQEVKEVIPNAVSFHKEFIPDEMRIIVNPQWSEDAGKYYLNIPNLDMSGSFTGKARFYVSNDTSGNNRVCKEVVCKKDASGNNTNTFLFENSWNNVFFYGKEVTDFHTIDKNQIFALHHSAIQELDRKYKREVESKEEKINSLQADNLNLQNKNVELQSEIDTLKSQMALVYEKLGLEL